MSAAHWPTMDRRRACLARRSVCALVIALAMQSLSTSSPASARADTKVAQRIVREMPAYQPSEAVSGTLRLWGHGSFRHDFMRQLIDAWMKAFNAHHPAVRFEYR